MMAPSRIFFLIATIFFPVVFGIIFPWLLDRPFPMWPHYFAGAFILLALLPDRPRDLAFWPIEKVSHILGIVNQTIIMGLIFYVIFTPIAIVRRIKGSDPLRLKLRNLPSYWVKSEDAKVDFTKPY